MKALFAVGTQWQAPTPADLLTRRHEFPSEIRHLHPSIPMNHQIEAPNHAVDTPAGHVDRCLRVKGAALVRHHADPPAGWRDMPLTTPAWCCVGVGVGVGVGGRARSEPATSAFLTGGTRARALALALESWQ